MFNCHVCGHDAAKPEYVSEVFHLDGLRVLVEHIPASVCLHCGEAVFSRETTAGCLRHDLSQPAGGKRRLPNLTEPPPPVLPPHA